MNGRLGGEGDDLAFQEFRIEGGPMDGGIMEIPVNRIPGLLATGLTLRKDGEEQDYEIDYLNGIFKAVDREGKDV